MVVGIREKDGEDIVEGYDAYGPGRYSLLVPRDEGFDMGSQEQYYESLCSRLALEEERFVIN